MYPERFDSLYQKICENVFDPSEREEYFDSIQRALMKLPDYFNNVASSSEEIKMAFYRFHDSERGAVIEEIDRRRRLSHQVMTNAINKLNRVGEMFGTGKIFDTDHELDMDLKEDRDIAAQFAWDFLKESVLSNVRIKDTPLVDLDKKYDTGVLQMEQHHIRIPHPTREDVFHGR